MGKIDIAAGDDLIMPIIQQKVQVAIVEALGNERGIIERVVAEAITRKVEKSKYSSVHVPWIDKVCSDVIREAASEAIKEWANSHKQSIADEFLRQLKTKKTSSSVVRAMIDGLVGAVDSKWKFSVELPE